VTLRLTAAVLVGRAVRVAARLRGGGSAIPGNIAMKIEPRFLEETISRIPQGVIAVSGSNGKSTTTNMLAAILRAHDLKVFTNPSGGNMPQGIASSVLAEVSLSGRLNADIAVLEIDEGYGIALTSLLKPRTVLLLNIQIDQLNRFHEPERVVNMLAGVAAAATRHLILNRDDNHLVDLDSKIPPSAKRQVTFFGAAPAVIERAAHGVASAQRFGESDVAPGSRDAAVTVTSLGASSAELATAEGTFSVRLPSRGLHYALDAAGATAAAKAVLGQTFDETRVAAALESLATVYGRGELLTIGDESVEIIMMKNPASLQLNLDALDEAPEQVFMAVDEGTPDPSWVYDIDLSALSHVDLITGSKANQFAVRLRYAGIPVGGVDLDIRNAVKTFLALPKPARGRKTMILNYEQMMLIRNSLGYKDLEGGSK
jgi:UDP-N-acetylmuramyl tripeptide synthase